MSDHTAFTNIPIVQYYHPPDSLHFQGAPATWNGFNNRTPLEVIEHARGDLGYLRRNGQTSDQIVSSEDCINLGTNTEGNQCFADFVLLNGHVSVPRIQDTPDAYGHAQVRLYDACSRPPQDWTVPCLSAGPVTFQRNPQVCVPPLNARTRFSFQLPQHAPVYPACTHNNPSPSLPMLFSADTFTTTMATSARSEALVYPDDDLTLPALEPTEEEQEVGKEVDELESDEETRMDVEEDRQTPAPALVHARIAHPHPLAMCGAGPYSPTMAHVDINNDALTLDFLYGPVPPFVPRAHSAPSPHPSITSSRPNSAAEPSDKATDIVNTDNDDSIVTSVDPAFPDTLYTLAQVARPFATQNWADERIEALTAARERVLTVIDICEEFLTPRMMNEVLGHTSFLRCDKRCVADYQLDREQYFHHHRPVFLPLVTPGEVRHLRTIAGVLSYHGLRSLSNNIEDLLQTSLPDEDIVYCLTQLGSLDNDGPLHLDAREVINTVQ
ncbi:hypothetical protein BV22DRAFT_1052685, partial [Leucogyrophana mollusca]